MQSFARGDLARTTRLECGNGIRLDFQPDAVLLPEILQTIAKRLQIEREAQFFCGKRRVPCQGRAAPGALQPLDIQRAHGYKMWGWAKPCTI